MGRLFNESEKQTTGGGETAVRAVLEDLDNPIMKYDRIHFDAHPTFGLPYELTNSSATYCKVGCHHGSLYVVSCPNAISLPSKEETSKINVGFMLCNKGVC